MSRVFLAIVGILVGGLFCAPAGWSVDSAVGVFRVDPALTGELPSREAPGPVGSLPIAAQTGNGEVRLLTKTPIAPYIEAVGGKEPTADELRLLPDKFRGNPLERYQLGAGVGIAVDDKSSLSLGYRFHRPLSLLDDSRQVRAAPREDLRIFFDVKLPFD